MTGLPLMVMSDEEIAGYGRSDAAGYGALRTERGLLPLVAMTLDARVAGVVATLRLTQTFVNTIATPIEATYIFPLPDRAAVHSFQMTVAGRVIDGVIDERGAARASYDQAIAAGHRAAITEEERPGVFTLRVGNLMPGEAATVTLGLVGPLPVDDGEVTFRFPLVVAPRYVPGNQLRGEQAGLGTQLDTDLVPDASRISPPVLLPYCPNPVRLALRVALEDGVVRDVASSLHAVTEARRDAQVIEVRPGERLDRDFILRWRIDGAALASSLVCADDGHGGGTFALTLVPPSTTAVAARPRDVVFVIDRSGSMEGWKMVAARRAAARMIDTLTARDRFCAIAFDDHAELLPAPNLVDATDRNRFRAVELLAKVTSRGGTEIAQPLRLALGLLIGGTADRERVIVLVTDGQVGNEAQIVGELGPTLRNIKMFTLGIDQAVNAAFLRQLASAGGGLCELVESEDRLDEVMTKVHRRIGTPIATELALRATGLELDRATLSPAKLPDVYAGAPVVVLGRYRGGARVGAMIEIEGTSLGDPLCVTVAATQPAGAGSWLAASWARAHLRDLEDRYAAGASPGLERTIVQVSKQFSVLSRFTAFLAIDRSEVANKGGVLHQVVQPVESPAGWANPGSASGPQLASPRVAGGYGGAPSKCYVAGSGSARSVSSNAPPMAAAPMASRPGYPPLRTGGNAPPPAMGGQPPPSVSSDAGLFPDNRGIATLFEADEMGVRSPADDEPMTLRSPLADEARRARTVPPRPPPAPAQITPVGSLAVGSVYRRQLTKLALELEHEAGAGNATAIRLVRQRLIQWVEDVRAAGLVELADAVELLVQRLSTALAAPASLAAEVGELVTALTALAAGAPPPPAPKQGRKNFWK